MHRPTIIVLCALLLGAGVLAGCGGGDDGVPATEAATAPEGGGATTAAGAGAGSAGPGDTLDATVGPDFTIGLTYDGQAVTELPAGEYTFAVDDQAGSHNFHLTGPGVDESTSVPETGTASWTVSLEPGEYTFVCDPHASSMTGSFTVG
jgi:plastocyanin